MSKAPAVDYALQIIEYAAGRNNEVGISDISNALGINKNAVSRVLESLTEGGWLYLSDSERKKYRLTLKPFSILSKGIAQNTLVKLARPYLKVLNETLGDSVYLGVKHGNSVMYQLHFDSVKEVRINGRVGGSYPLHCSAPGKVLLSYCDKEFIENYFKSESLKRTENTVISAQEFFKQSEEIKKNGYACDNEEFARGIICIACPVFDSEGEASAAVGISSLTVYDTVKSLVNEKLPLLRQTAESISLNSGSLKKEI